MIIVEGIGRLSGGGAETQVKMLSSGLVAQGHSVTLAHIVPAVESRDFDGTLKLFQLHRRSKWDWVSIFTQVGQILDRERPDIVHAWLPEVISIPMAVMAVRRRIPLVTSIRRSTFKGVGGANWLRDAMGLIPHFFSSHIVSNFTIKDEPWIVRALAACKGHSVIRNGIDMHVYSSSIQLDPLDCIRLVFVGRFAPQKRLSLLLKAVSRMPLGQVELTIFGSSTDEVVAEHRALVSRLGISEYVSFKGFHPNWRLHAGKFHALVLPSVSEGMPNVVVEAMAESLPVLASNIPEISSLVQDGINGYLFDVDSLDGIVSTFERLRGTRLDCLRRGARKTAERFSSEVMVAAYSELYQSIIANR